MFRHFLKTTKKEGKNIMKKFLALLLAFAMVLF